jgi:hypothetical protein
MVGAGLASQMLNPLAPVSPAGAVRAPASSGGDWSGKGTAEGEGGRFGPAVVVSFGKSGRSGSSGKPASGTGAMPGDELSEEERRQVDELKARDREVRTHEMAHMTAGGQYAGSPSYTYQTGPDGERYAIGGEVMIDTSPEKDPAATIAKMEVVKRAALAPAEPSAQDVKVAQMAEQQRAQAQAELSRQRAEEAETGGDGEARRGAAPFAAAAAAYGGAEGLDAARGPRLLRTA